MKTFVLIPTYNEKENIVNLIDAILKLKIKDMHILVVDDNSPDETWKIVKDITKKNQYVHLLLRTKNKGRGLAGRAAFICCLNKGADIIIEMDADFSHDPKYIPLMLKELENADLVIGSRMVEGGKTTGRSKFREFITWVSTVYITTILGLRVKDCNSGFRCFKRKVLEGINVYKLRAKGSDIVQEVLYKAHLKKFKIKEVPITFTNRTKGDSKLGLRQLIDGYLIVLKLRFLRLIGEI